MPIKVACQCGQRFVAKDSFVGKTVKCPKCGRPLKIPDPKPAQGREIKKSDGMSDLLDEAGLKKGVIRCPGCGTPLPEEAILCVACGYDLRLGHRIKPRVGVEAELEEDELANLPVHGNPLLDHVERQMARDKIELKQLGKGVPWWVFLLALVGLIGFALGMVSMPQDRVMEVSGMVLIVAGWLLYTFFWIRLIVVSFQESALHGVLFMFVPFYSLYYVSTRWNRVGGLFLLALLCSVLAGAGYGLIMISAMMESKKNEDPMNAGCRFDRPATVCAASPAELGFRVVPST